MKIITVKEGVIPNRLERRDDGRTVVKGYMLKVWYFLGIPFFQRLMTIDDLPKGLRRKFLEKTEVSI